MPELIKNLAYSSSRNTNAPEKDKSVSRHMIAKQTKGNKPETNKKSVVWRSEGQYKIYLGKSQGEQHKVHFFISRFLKLSCAS